MEQGTQAKKFTEPVALSSPEPAGVPLPRTPLGLGFDLPALRARCWRQSTEAGNAVQEAASRKARSLRTSSPDRSRDGPAEPPRSRELLLRTGREASAARQPSKTLASTRHNTAYRALAGEPFIHAGWREAAAGGGSAHAVACAGRIAVGRSAGCGPRRPLTNVLTPAIAACRGLARA
jgi:hypothetical protein